MKTEDFLKAIDHISDEKILEADRPLTKKKFPFKGFTLVATLVLVTFLSILIKNSSLFTDDFSPDGPITNKSEGFPYESSVSISQSFEPYSEPGSNPDSSIGVYFIMNGYAYEMADNLSSISWKITIDVDQEDLGEYVGEIQYGNYQAGRSMAGKPYTISYGVFDKNGKIQEGIYDKEKGQTFSENPNLEGGKVYRSPLNTYMYIVELNGQYKLFVGRIITEADQIFKNIFDYYDIKDASNIDFIDVKSYEWRNGKTRTSENLLHHAQITDPSAINRLISLLTPLEGDRDNGSKMSKTRSAYRDSYEGINTKSATIEIHLTNGYIIEFEYRQQYNYILLQIDDLQLPEDLGEEFESTLEIK